MASLRFGAYSAVIAFELIEPDPSIRYIRLLHVRQFLSVYWSVIFSFSQEKTTRTHTQGLCIGQHFLSTFDEEQGRVIREIC